jgi:hypothetical protein
MNENVKSLWDRFSAMVLDPIHAGDVQRSECRRAFYAGATAMFTLVLEASEPPEEEVCVINMDLINQELEAWTKTIGTDAEKAR